MKEVRAHPWHNQVFCWVNIDERLEGIKDKPANEINLRAKLIGFVIPSEAIAELDAIYAKWQPELDAVVAKRRAECNALHAKHCDPNCPWDGQTIFTHQNERGEWCMKNEGRLVERKP